MNPGPVRRPSSQRLTKGSPMTTPQTTLDERFSQPGSDPTSWDQARAVLETAELTWLTTVRADGRPHQTPLVAVWHDGALHFSTGTREQKTVNLSRNPHVLLTVAGRDWQEGLEGVGEGGAVQITDEEPLGPLAQARA